MMYRYCVAFSFGQIWESKMVSELPSLDEIMNTIDDKASIRGSLTSETLPKSNQSALGSVVGPPTLKYVNFESNNKRRWSGQEENQVKILKSRDGNGGRIIIVL
ncbi:hypothetical protein TNCV_3603911 [Trichonephila clavipes]|nr:hypothetical protein TNCV_3603911 [Trichonephila clavipes]